MAEDVWSTPGGTPQTPDFDSEEGHPVLDGWTAHPVYYSNAAAHRAGKRLKGVYYTNDIGGARADSLWTLEDGRFDESRRVLYRLLCGLQRLHFLFVGPWPNESALTGDGYTNWLFRYEITATPADSTSIDVTWADEDAGNLLSLSLAPNSAAKCSVAPCMGVSDDINGFFSIAQIVDIELTGANAATLTLNKAVNSGRSNKIWLFFYYQPPPYPVPRLYVDPGDVASPVQCHHAIRTFYNLFSSFKTYHGGKDMAAGIVDDWFCGRMNDGGTDLTGFTARCNFTDCPNYTPYVPYYWNANDLSRILMARGCYDRQLVFGVPDAVRGRDVFEGILTFAGLPFTYRRTGLTAHLAVKDFFGWGLLKHRTGEKTDRHFDIFRNFVDQQDFWRNENTTEQDDGAGVFGQSFPDTSKRDPSGGEDSDNRELWARGNMTPGFFFESRMIRRVGHSGVGETATVAGDGDRNVQGVRPRKYVSPRFTKGAAQVTNNTETNLTVYSSTQTTTGGDNYDVEWEVSRFGELATDPITRRVESAPGALIKANSIASNILTVDFALGSVDLFIPAGTPPDPPSTDACDCGGNVVKPQISHEFTNPNVARRIGDRQSLIFPGKSVSFDAEAVRDVYVRVIGAQAYGGQTQGGAAAPHANAPGVPKFIRDNFDSQDRVKIALEGENGQKIAAWVDGGGLDGDNVSLENMGFVAVAPETFSYNGSSTGYAPVIKYLDRGGSSPTTINAADYIWDPNTGKLYLDTSNLPATPVNLFFDGWVCDQRRNYPCESVTRIDAMFDQLCTGYSFAGLTTGGLSIGIGEYPEGSPEIWRLDVFIQPYFHDPVVHGSGGSFSVDSVNDLIHVEPGTTWIEEWREPGAPPGLAIGNTIIDAVPLHITLKDRALCVTFLDCAARWRGAEIGTAVVDVTLTDAVIWQESYEWDEGDVTKVNTEITPAEQVLALEAWYIKVNVDDTLSIERVGGAAGTLTRYTSNGLVEYNGTVVITDIAKSLADSSRDSDYHLAWVLVGPDGPLSAANGYELAFSWLNSWTGEYDGGGNRTYEYVEVRRIAGGSLTLSNFRISPDAEEIKSASNANFPFTASGHVLMPDLFASP